MEPQEKIYCYDNRPEKETKKRNCFCVTTIILLTAFAVVIGLIIGLGYGIMEVWDLVKDFVVNGWTWDIIRENFRGISLAAIELAVIGQSYIIAKQAKIDK